MNFDSINFLIATAAMFFGVIALGFVFMCDMEKYKNRAKFHILASVFSFITAFFVYLLWKHRDGISIFIPAGLICLIFLSFFYSYKAVGIFYKKTGGENKKPRP